MGEGRRETWKGKEEPGVLRNGDAGERKGDERVTLNRKPLKETPVKF